MYGLPECELGMELLQIAPSFCMRLYVRVSVYLWCVIDSCSSSHKRKSKNESATAAGVSIIWKSIIVHVVDCINTIGGHFFHSNQMPSESPAREKNISSISHFL